VRFRAAGTAVALLGALAPVALVSALWLAGAGHARATEAMLAAGERTTQALADTIRERYEMIGHAMGHDMAVVSADIDLQQYYTAGYASRTMPESAAAALAGARPGLDHIVARLAGLVEWPEQGIKTLLVGVGPEQVRDPAAAPLLAPVPAGYVRVGHRLAADLGLSVGQRVALRGESLTVAECLDEAGSLDDMSLWVDLALAQRMLGVEGRIGDILAFCGARSAEEAMTAARAVEHVLPGVRAVPHSADVRTRERMRRAADSTSGDMVALERSGRAEVSAQRGVSFGAIGLIAAVAGAAWVAAASYVNTRQRRREIGILRTVGWSAGRVVVLFAWKGAVLGTAGALGGVAAGAAAAFAAARAAVGPGDWPALAGVACAGLLVCALSYTLPALAAAGGCPADTLAGR